jgi:uncharacterized Zn finger protein
MSDTPAEIETLKAAIAERWSEPPGSKAQAYVGAFFDAVRVAQKITAKVVGNHGTYTVSIEAEESQVLSACSCYIGKGGYCHHCTALAATFLKDPTQFKETKLKKREEIQDPTDVASYLHGASLETLLKQLSENGITQKAFAEIIGMNPRHLSALKSSEARHHIFNELGATKLACLWVLEHLTEIRK